MGKLVQTAGAAVLVLLSTLATPALADDWVATKLRGAVLQLVDSDWVRLKRGDVVPDDRVIRTLRSGNVQFRREAETIDLGPETQIQIFDRAGSARYTTVRQYFGKVTVEAEVQNVQHFEVRTPHLAAVVKGTKFVVVSGSDAANVRVNRGHVAVEDLDNRQSVTVAAGQEATATDGESLGVSGKGLLPVVLNADGRPLVEIKTVADDANVAGVGVNLGGNGNSGNGGANGNSGSGSNGNGNGNGNGGGGGVVSGLVGTAGGIVGGLL